MLREKDYQNTHFFLFGVHREKDYRDDFCEEKLMMILNIVLAACLFHLGCEATCSIQYRMDLDIHLATYFSDPHASHDCGDISTWDVSRVTDMSYLFCALQESWTPFECDSNRQSFNADISGWDVSKVTSLEGIFMGTTSFDLTHITQWNMSQVRIFDKDLFTYLNPRHDVCTERNIRLSAKDGVRF